MSPKASSLGLVVFVPLRQRLAFHITGQVGSAFREDCTELTLKLHSPLRHVRSA